MSPYRLERLELEGVPSMPYLSAVYLITMEGSPRRHSYVSTLQESIPLNEITIVHNKGYDSGRKMGVKNPTEDLWHANLYVLDLHRRRFSNRDNYFLLLEDDAFFNDLHKDTFIIERSLRLRPDALFLGASPLISVKINNELMRTWLTGETHAVVYHSSVIRKILDRKLPTIGSFTCPHDLFVSALTRCYATLKPISVQPHPLTTNMKQWDVTGLIVYYYATFGGGEYPSWNMARFHHNVGNYGGFLPYIIGLVVLVMYGSRAAMLGTRTRCY